jgi:nicotinate-nucleotide pyrophosphorylase
MPRKLLEQKLLSLLEDDVGQGDVTSQALVPASCKAQAVVLLKPMAWLLD